jgi:hypothetical protein
LGLKEDEQHQQVALALQKGGLSEYVIGCLRMRMNHVDDSDEGDEEDQNDKARTRSHQYCINDEKAQVPEVDSVDWPPNVAVVHAVGLITYIHT